MMCNRNIVVVQVVQVHSIYIDIFNIPSNSIEVWRHLEFRMQNDKKKKNAKWWDRCWWHTTMENAKGQLPFIYDGCQNDSDDNDNRNRDISYGLVFSQQLVQGACLPKSLILIPY